MPEQAAALMLPAIVIMVMVVICAMMWFVPHLPLRYLSIFNGKHSQISGLTKMGADNCAIIRYNCDFHCLSSLMLVASGTGQNDLG